MSLRRRYDDLRDRYDARIARDETEQEADATEQFVMARLAAQLDTVKTVVAEHIVAARHPSSALSDAASMGLALQEALEAAGVDLRLELARLEGADL
jgi:hypothetical protein